MSNKSDISRNGGYVFISTSADEAITTSSSEAKTKRLEDYEPGASRDQVFDALKQATRPIKAKVSKKKST